MSYYDALGVSRSASSSEIDAAYRKRALALHPDRPGGDSSKFQQLNRIHKVLSNEEKREAYDRRCGAEEAGTGDMFSSTVALLPWLASSAASGVVTRLFWSKFTLLLAPLLAACVALLAGDDAATRRRRGTARRETIASVCVGGFFAGVIFSWICGLALDLAAKLLGFVFASSNSSTTHITPTTITSP